jgi:hypothetical protein
MSKRREWQAGVICVVLMALLAPAALALDFPLAGDPSGMQYSVYNPLPADGMHFIRDAKVDFVGGSSVPENEQVYILNGAKVNFIDCVFGAGSVINLIDDSSLPGPFPVVTFHGTGFSDENGPILPSVTQIGSESASTSFTLGGFFNGVEFSVHITCASGHFINLAWLNVIEVDVDIKPDSADNTVNLGSNGVVPVGILSEVAEGVIVFDATEIDPDTVTLAGAGVAIRGKGSKLLSSEKDLNGDGVLDLEVKVETQSLVINPEDGAAILEGETYGGQAVKGVDYITVVPIE